MRWYREFIPDAPDISSGFFAFLEVPPGPPFPEHLRGQRMCGVVVVLYRPGRRRTTSSRRCAPPRRPLCTASRGCRSRPAERVRRLYPPGHQWYWRADFVNELTDEAIAAHVEHGAKHADDAVDDAPLPDRRRGGRRGKDATAWAYRDAKWAQVIVGVDPDPANARALTRLDRGLLGGAAPATRRAAPT